LKASLRRTGNLYKWLIRIISLAAVLTAWQIFGSLVPVVVSTPTDIASGFSTLLSNPVPYGIDQLSFLPELGATVWTFFVGFALATVAGVIIGAAMARWKVIETALDPYITALYNTPYVAIAPLFMILFGVGFLARVIVVFLSVVFVVIINSMAGFKTTNRDLVETARSFGSSGLPLQLGVVLPGAVPFITTGMRLGALRGLVGAIVAESVVQITSLGYMILYYEEAVVALNIELAIVVVMAVIGLAVTESMKYVESFFSKWRVTLGST
jgi:ABC-type nitrate/sulfonate/bicarbonate transport system permease component